MADTFAIVVGNTNDAPTIAAIANPASIGEDSGLQTVGVTGITAGGESQSLTVSAVSSNPALVPNPSVSYTSPAATATATHASPGTAGR